MSLINEKYEKVVCISLKEREDKFDYMHFQFETHDIEAEFFRPVIPGYAKALIEPYNVKYNSPDGRKVRFNPAFPNELGALQSHYHVIKTALLEGVKSLFIFEDDCAFSKNWETLLPKYMDTIPEDADGILLYSYMSAFQPENTRVKPRWVKGFASWSILAYGMNRGSMERYIAIADAQPMIADSITLFMMTNLGFNFYIATPPLVIPTKELTSNIRGENKNYGQTPMVGGGNIFMLGIDEKNYE
jgi:GR25 family glycosyltransferase involved in LPS biosynthesis